ncbi:hypothetical protein B0H16DRAFT_1375950 [Mycena metata]|uniref:G-protein coupled receptors family 1 profile domain-containing protein n=1 Tax=Mycena metata TaxID=1033252 RepID=A0AAD7N5D0_9AGAR|nr:hypothetical protein B0H16DRAFT_1375950 [Mycena metata]
MSTLQFSRFTAQEIPGVVVVNAFAILSSLALLSVASRVIWLALRRFFSKNPEPQTREYVFFNTVLGNYAACLLISNMVIGAAGMMGLRQLMAGGIQEGTFCNVQAIVMQAGNYANAYFTVAIGIHTFNSLVLARRQSVWICVLTIAVGWLSAIAFAAAPTYTTPALGSRYGVSGLGCGVRPVYPRSLFLFHLLPIFITSVISAFVFSLIFLVLRGTLVVRGGLKFTLDPNERWGGNAQNYHRFVARIARSMLWFPIAYVIFLVPYAVARLIDLSGGDCPFPLLVAAYVCWFMLGIANVLTLYNTFRVLGPAFDARSTSQKDLESNVSGSRSRVMPPMIAVGEEGFSYRPSESMSEKTSMSERSRPNSLSSFNQVQPASGENPGAPFRLQAPPLAARIQERREEYANDLERTHSRTDSEASNWTVNAPSFVSAPSFYDYGTTPSIDAPPRGKTRLSKLLLEEASNGAPIGRVRSASPRSLPPTESPMQSLPAPPRVNRQVAAKRTVSVQPNSPVGSVEVRYSTTTDGSQEMDITGWVTQQRPDGYMPRGLISAVGNNHYVPPVPADEVPLPGRGSLDITRSRSALASEQRRHRRGDSSSSKGNRPRNNSVPDAPKFF